MEFGILGPLLVRDGTGARPVPAAKQRALLAALLVRRGQVVPTEVLVDTVWDGRPPRTAATTLRNYVMRLRRALGAAGERLATEAGGYLLAVHADELDADRFIRLRDVGHALLRDDEPERAAAHFEQALALWRGPTLVDLPSETLRRTEADWLAEARLDILEGRAEAVLALGRHPELLDGLRSLTAAHPERERLWAQLMTTLYRCGRRSEALAVYERARRVLADELGVRPGRRTARRTRRRPAHRPRPDGPRPDQHRARHPVPTTFRPARLHRPAHRDRRPRRPRRAPRRRPLHRPGRQPAGARRTAHRPRRLPALPRRTGRRHTARHRGPDGARPFAAGRPADAGRPGPGGPGRRRGPSPAPPAAPPPRADAASTGV
ncbi:AfsR/SARP family transcriptional regulator [Kitasatospora griseola]|uniref:AfsR/SARP family transcriptional regulator n=1 Tax=Kitasatospora griseola TaxID=2064 RepID=UPI00166F9716|nr:AfsR/SARP family transcriptional regulator [Kitasatospora griseola]GGQ85374.1 hypothetical protein GCM10010195_46270 [Kitasatospora griseola]